MLSTEYRLKLEGICNRIIASEAVSLEEMIWAEKLAKANRSAGTILRQARRRAENPDMVQGGLDDFLNQLDIGGVGEKSRGIRGFNTPQDIVDFFSQDGERPDDWRQRD